jgi:hypothetical protein
MATSVTITSHHEGKRERNASNLSGALDLVAPDWQDHVSMGL